MTDDKLYMSLSANTIMAKLTNTIHLTLKMTSAQVVEMSVTSNISFQNYPHADDHTIRTIITLYSVMPDYGPDAIPKARVVHIVISTFPNPPNQVGLRMICRHEYLYGPIVEVNGR